MSISDRISFFGSQCIEMHQFAINVANSVFILKPPNARGWYNEIQQSCCFINFGWLSLTTSLTCLCHLRGQKCCRWRYWIYFSQLCYSMFNVVSVVLTEFRILWLRPLLPHCRNHGALCVCVCEYVFVCFINKTCGVDVLTGRVIPMRKMMTYLLEIPPAFDSFHSCHRVQVCPECASYLEQGQLFGTTLYFN